MAFSSFLVLANSVPAAEIQLYGRAHLSIDQLSDGEDSGFNVSSNASRLGFRANAEIVEGVKAIMQLEQEIRYENGSGNFSTRDSFVGLETEYGTFRLGFFDTPLKLVGARVDLFRDQIGEVRNLTRVRDNYSGADFDFDTRFRNGIHYRSPQFNNLTVDIHYATNTDAGVNTTGNNDAVSTAVTYQANGTYLAASWERKNDTGSAAVRLGASKPFGAFRINGLLQQATVKDSSLVAEQQVNTYGLGASFRHSDKITFKSQYLWVNADGDERDAAMLAVGVDYLLSSAFRVLLAYATTSNDDAVRYAMSKGGHGAQVTPPVGETTDGISLGFRFDF